MAEDQPGLVRRIQAGPIWLGYRTWGSAGAPPLVLLHALGEQSSDWAPVAAALASTWRVYAPDLRGHGASDWTGPYTIEQLTTDLAAFLDALGLAQVALVGHSIGGPPAYLHAARHPASVTRLVLEDPAPPWPRSPRVLARPDGPLPFDWDVTALSNEFTDPQVSSWRDELRRVQAAALVIAGGPASHVDQGQLAGMAALIPDCTLMTIPAGHLVHAARLAEFTSAATTFLGPRRFPEGDSAGTVTGASGR
jgi:pimeloyl-ACP methyl ester carboxylesterase